MTQRQINAAAMRSLKMSYKWFTPVQKRLIKAQEQIDRNTKECTTIERSLIARHGKGWRRHPGAENDLDYSLYMGMQLDNIKLSERISHLEEKHGLECTELMGQFRELNRGRCYGGSF